MLPSCHRKPDLLKIPVAEREPCRAGLTGRAENGEEKTLERLSGG